MTTPTRPKRAAKKGKAAGPKPTPTALRLSDAFRSEIRSIVREELATRAGTVPSEPTEGEVEELALVLYRAFHTQCGNPEASDMRLPGSQRDSYLAEARAALAHLRSKP